MVFNSGKNIRYNLVCGAYCNKAIDANGYKTTRKFQIENLRLILSVGEPLHAEAVIWGQENFGTPFSQLVANGNWRNHDSQLPSMEVKPGSMGKPLPDKETAILK
jgi:acetyl-CoA synthetase